MATPQAGGRSLTFGRSEKALWQKKAGQLKTVGLLVGQKT
jgi:hypothetical protein